MQSTTAWPAWTAAPTTISSSPLPIRSCWRVSAHAPRGGERHARVNELRLADLTLNRLTRRVRRGEHEVELTGKEFALLEFMLLHPDQALSRTQIGEHVWGYDFYNESNIVDVYVGYLRRKLDEGHALQLIRTVRGVGYKLSAES